MISDDEPLPSSEIPRPTMPPSERVVAAATTSPRRPDLLRECVHGGTVTSDEEPLSLSRRISSSRLQEVSQLESEVVSKDEDAEGDSDDGLLLPQYRNMTTMTDTVDGTEEVDMVPDSLLSEVDMVPDSLPPEVDMVPDSLSPDREEKKGDYYNDDDDKPLTIQQVCALYEECNGDIKKFMLGLMLPQNYGPASMRKRE